MPAFTPAPLVGEATIDVAHGAAYDVPQVFRPGERVGDRHTIIRLVNRGGMGEVYEALDEQLGERIALKTVRPEIADNEAIRAAFKREIHLARRVTHPNVCRMFDLGFAGRTLFLSMELLPGESLASRLLDVGRLCTGAARDIARQIAAGLAAAHAAGIVHGDLKPANVMLVPEDGGERAVVTDFGLAGCWPAQESVERAENETVMGTPAYLAPEVLDEPATAKADIFAFGVLLYRMVTGALPFDDQDHTSIAEGIRRRRPPVPPRKLVPTLDRAWERAILCCLERRPAARFARAEDVVRALDPRPAPRRTAAVLSVALALAVSVSVLAAERPPARGPAQRAPARPASPIAALHYQNGVALARRWEFHAAAAELRLAVAAEPGSALAHAALADALWESTEPDEARRGARHALDLAETAGEEEKLVAEAIFWKITCEPKKEAAVLARLRRVNPQNPDYPIAELFATLLTHDLDAASRLVAEVRRLGPPFSDDVRLDVAELNLAQEAMSPDVGRLAERVVKNATLRGIRAVRLEGHEVLAEVRWLEGELSSAVFHLRELRRLAHAAGERSAELRSRLNAAEILAEAGRIAEARLELGAPPDEDRLIARANHADSEALIALQAGDLGVAGAAFEEEKRLRTQAQGRHDKGVQPTLGLASVAAATGDLELAERLATKARSLLSKPTSDLSAWVDIILGDIALARGDTAAAATHYRAARDIKRAGRSVLGVTRLDVALSRVALREARPLEAETLAREAARIFKRLDLPDDAALAAVALAEALVAQGKRAQAEEALAPAAATERSSERPSVRLAIARARTRIEHAFGIR